MAPASTVQCLAWTASSSSLVRKTLTYGQHIAAAVFDLLSCTSTGNSQPMSWPSCCLLSHTSIGIGGMRYALERVVPPSWRLHVEAIDVNMVANAVHEHNFGDQPHTFDLEQVWFMA